MSDKPKPQDVIVRDIEMEFPSMVIFMLKWLAAGLIASLVIGAVLFFPLMILGLISI